METDVEKAVGGNASTGSADSGRASLIVQSEFNRRMRQALTGLVDAVGFTNWIDSQGTTFGLLEGEPVVYVQGGFHESWLTKYWTKFLGPAFQKCLGESASIPQWRYIANPEVCERAKSQFLSPVVTGVETERLGEDLAPRPAPSFKSARKQVAFCFGQLPESLLNLDDFVAIGNDLNRVAWQACQEAAKPTRKRPRVTSLCLAGSASAGKKTLLLGVAKAINAIAPTVKIVYMTGIDFVGAYTSCFGEKGSDRIRLRLLNQRLQTADILLVADLQQMRATTKESQKILASAMDGVMRRGGRVLVSLSSGGELNGELSRVLGRLPTFQVEAADQEEARVAIAENLVKRLLVQSQDGSFLIKEEVIRLVVDSLSLGGFEGAFRNLIFTQDQLNRSFTAQEARSCLGLIKTETKTRAKKSLKAADLVDIVLRSKILPEWQTLNRADLSSGRRNQELVWARYLVWYLAYDILKLGTLEQIDPFGKNYATVLAGLKQIRERLARDEKFKAAVDVLVQQVLGQFKPLTTDGQPPESAPARR